MPCAAEQLVYALKRELDGVAKEREAMKARTSDQCKEDPEANDEAPPAKRKKSPIAAEECESVGDERPVGAAAAGNDDPMPSKKEVSGGAKKVGDVLTTSQKANIKGLPEELELGETARFWETYVPFLYRENAGKQKASKIVFKYPGGSQGGVGVDRLFGYRTAPAVGTGKRDKEGRMILTVDGKGQSIIREAFTAWKRTEDAKKAKRNTRRIRTTTNAIAEDTQNIVQHGAREETVKEAKEVAGKACTAAEAGLAILKNIQMDIKDEWGDVSAAWRETARLAQANREADTAGRERAEKRLALVKQVAEKALRGQSSSSPACAALEEILRIVA